MRSVLASGLILGLLMSLCASADAATAHHVKSRRHLILGPGPIIMSPNDRVTPPARFAVPGWTDEQTRHWLYNATSCAYCG